MVNQSFDSGATDSYKLIVTFEKDLENPDQNDNAGKELTLTISADSNQNAQLVSGY